MIVPWEFFFNTTYPAVPQMGSWEGEYADPTLPLPLRVGGGGNFSIICIKKSLKYCCRSALFCNL